MKVRMKENPFSYVLPNSHSLDLRRAKSLEMTRYRNAKPKVSELSLSVPAASPADQIIKKVCRCIN